MFASDEIDIDDCIVIVKNVPSQACGQCGEVSYSDETAKQLEKVVDLSRSSLTTIAVVNYPHDAA